MFRSASKDDWRPDHVAEIRRSGVVPANAVALPLDRGAKLLRGGSHLPGLSILVPIETIKVELTFPDLADKDGVTATLRIQSEIDPPDGTTGLRLLAEALGEQDSFTIEELSHLLSKMWQDTLASRAARFSWSDPGDLTDRLELESELPKAMQEMLFDRGLRIQRIVSAEAGSDALSAAIEMNRQRREEAARIRDRLEFLELWKKEEKGEALAREEIEKLASHLKQQGLLRKIEHDRVEQLQRIQAHEELHVARERVNRRLAREKLTSEVEIDQARLQKELEQAERLKASFEQNGWLALVRAIDDVEGQTRLLERLIEKEMTPEQIAARGVSLTQVEKLEARIEALQVNLENRNTPQALKGVVEGIRPVQRIWLAAGLALYRIDGDPALAERRARPGLPPEDLGYLRSVRVIRGTAGTEIAVGGQGGVGLYRPEGSHWEFFGLRPGEAGRGGVNSASSDSDMVVGSHSRLGLNVWSRLGQQRVARPFETQLTNGHSTRAVQRAAGGGWVFAHGSEIFHAESLLEGAQLRSLGTLPESVTALCGSGDSLWAGTMAGQLFRQDRAGDWQEIPFKTAGPIYQIEAPVTDGPQVWIVGARQSGVHVLDAQGGLLAEYRSRYPIRWVGAGAGGPVAVDRFGQHVIVWKWETPDAPICRVRVPDQIHSIAVEQEESR